MLFNKIVFIKTNLHKKAIEVASNENIGNERTANEGRSHKNIANESTLMALPASSKPSNWVMAFFASSDRAYWCGGSVGWLIAWWKMEK